MSDSNYKCIYCNTLKDSIEFSLEHIFPSALGGKVITDNFFKTRNVCRECNNKLGLGADGLFLKNFFIKNSTSMDFLGYIDLENPKYTIPFIYLGLNEHIKHPEYTYCDYWLWQGGGRVYHFHNNYSDKFNAFAGGNPIGQKDKRRAGEAYLVSSTNNLVWIKKLLFSFKEHFKYAKRYSVNINIQNENDLLDVASDKENEIIKNILAIANDEQKNQIVIQLGFEIRFLSKVALALGCNLFGDDYYRSSYAQMLRKVIWEEDHTKLENYQHQMSSFFSDQNNPLKQVSEIIAWKGGHTIVLFPIDNKLLLLLYISGNKNPIILTITDEFNKFNNTLTSEFPNGCVWILIPQRQIFKGKYGFPEYLAYKMGDKSLMEDLSEIENLYVEFENLPPFVI
ncbi:HNH endonuclease [Sulfuricurvum sp.]|uniref:HNH endonuclease n=1 Tax=Sulfuricurvum sp. TaxID=2025608 RepID=UPI003565143A